VIAREIVAVILLCGGLFFLLLGSVGIVRFPDFYTRLHPAGKSETMGASLVVLSLAVHEGWALVALKVVLVQIFIFFGNPAAAHAMGRAAWRAGLRPWAGVGEKRR
jgi:multicomponent Na+:H+ antiporter subunit G